jgi:predicted DNA-binding transcriptional regulator YafY
MPTTSNALLRYRILDRCFSNFHKIYTIEDLLDEVNERLIDFKGKGISERQIRDDIKYMRDRVTFDAPIVAIPYEGKKCHYCYSDSNFSIFKNELSDEDLSKLHSTIEMLGRYRGIPANLWLEEVISNLEYRFGVKANSENIVSFDQNEQLKGLEFLSDIIDATINHQTLEINYKTYKGVEIRSILHPYYVKQYNGRWFLFGLDNKHNIISNLAFDRIQNIKLSSIEFKKNENIDFNTYFNDIIGVSIPKEDVRKEIITLRFTKERFPYVVSKPIHQSQMIVKGKQCEIELRVKPNRELSQQIFSFIPDVEIVSPQWLREEIVEKIKDNLKKYLSMQNSSTVTK